MVSLGQAAELCRHQTLCELSICTDGASSVSSVQARRIKFIVGRLVRMSTSQMETRITVGWFVLLGLVLAVQCHAIQPTANELDLRTAWLR